MASIDDLVGAPVQASALVTGQGRGSMMTGEIFGGAIGKAVAEGRAQERTTSPIPADSEGYLALTADELVLLSAKNGAFTKKPKEVLQRVPRSQIREVALGEGKMQVALVVAFADETFWSLEVPRPVLKKAKGLIAAVNG